MSIVRDGYVEKGIYPSRIPHDLALSLTIFGFIPHDLGLYYEVMDCLSTCLFISD